MAARAIFNEAIDLGIVLYLEDEKLKFRAEIGGFPDALKLKLREHKAEIIQYLQGLEKEKNARGWKLPPLLKYQGEKQAELSFAQQRLWFIDKLEGGSPQYNMPGAFMLEGVINHDAFIRSIATILERHHVLRTRFNDDNDPVTQWVVEDYELPFTEVDLSDWDEQQRELEVQRLANLDAHTAFDLSQDLLLRIGLIELSETEHMVLFNMHHIASDGWSKSILMNEFAVIYKAYCEDKPNPLAELPIQYLDFSKWQRDWMQGDILNNHLNYWKTYLKDIPGIHQFPLDYKRTAQQTFDGKVKNSVLDDELTKKIRHYCQHNEVTLFMFLQTAFAMLIARYSLENDIVMGTPVAGRHSQELEDLIGFFVNTLVIRTQFDNKQTFKQVLEKSKKNIIDVFDHQHIPFEMLVEELRPERSLSHSPVFQMLFVLQNYDRGNVDLSGLDSKAVGQDNTVIKFDMELAVVEFEHNIGMSWIYNTALFNQSTINRLTANFAVLINAVVDNDKLAIHSYPLISDSEQQQLNNWSQGEQQQQSVTCIQQLFEKQAAIKPSAIALNYKSQSITYHELNTQANQLARHLIKQGVVADQIVALYFERSIEMVVAIIAVLKAGGAYLPLDPSLPLERIKLMLTDAAPNLLLSTASSSEILIDISQKIINIDTENFDSFESDDIDISITKTSSHSLAYVIYTSGSTGQPKGVLVEHQAIIHRVQWLQSQYPLSDTDAMLLKTSYSFDVSVVEFLWTLSSGCRLIIAEADGHKDPEYIAHLMQQQRVSVVQFAPSTLRSFLNIISPRHFSDLRYVLCAGEALDRELIEQYYSCDMGAELYNLYGPTEAAVYASYWGCSQYQTMPVSIGKPLSETELLVLDNNQQQVPIGVAGELYIGGSGLARAYHGQAQLTTQKFVHTDGRHGRYYRTGDLVRWLPEGQLEYIGRQDNQVKIRGFRIELGEIESCLKGLANIDDARILLHSAGKDKATENQQLVAYMTLEKHVEAHSDEQNINQMRSQLSELLPDYMVPLHFIILSQMPLNSSGKINNKQLPKPDANLLSVDNYIAPRDDIERKLCEIWQDLLTIEQVGIEDNFFQLGGHSLLIARLAKEIEQAFAIKITVRILFERLTIAEFSAWLTIYIANTQQEDHDNDDFIEEEI